MKMKRSNIYLTLAALLMCMTGVLTSCDIETSGNGKLDGYWHMTAVDTIATGGTADLSQKRLFWGVQHKLINLSDRDNLAYNIWMRFEHQHRYCAYTNHITTTATRATLYSKMRRNLSLSDWKDWSSRLKSRN